MSVEEAERVEQVALGGTVPAGLAEADIAIIAFARKLTRTPSLMAEADVIALRAQGLSDREIYDVAAIAGFFAYVNRIVSGLGVPLEEDWRRYLPP